MEIRRWRFIPGRVLSPNEKSKTGLYGIMSVAKHIALRISCIQEIAELQRDDNRYICEMFIDTN